MGLVTSGVGRLQTRPNVATLMAAIERIFIVLGVLMSTLVMIDRGDSLNDEYTHQIPSLGKGRKRQARLPTVIHFARNMTLAKPSSGLHDRGEMFWQLRLSYSECEICHLG